MEQCPRELDDTGDKDQRSCSREQNAAESRNIPSPRVDSILPSGDFRIAMDQ